MSPNMDSPHKSPIASPGYETRDANVRGVFGFLVVLSVVIVATILICWGVFRYYSAHQPEAAFNSPFGNTRQLPAGPQLQVNPREDLLKYQEEHRESLETYSWENRGAGVVRVPIERAKELLIQKGVPVQSVTATQSSKKNVTPNAPTSMSQQAHDLGGTKP